MMFTASEIDRLALLFRQSLTPEDVTQISLARDIFHSSWVVPLLLYLVLEKHIVLPTSISWTIRTGFPRAAHHATWLVGWLLFLHVLIQQSSLVVGLFALQMFLTGIVAVILFPLGRSGVHKL